MKVWNSCNYSLLFNPRKTKNL